MYAINMAFQDYLEKVIEIQKRSSESMCLGLCKPDDGHTVMIWGDYQEHWIFGKEK